MKNWFQRLVAALVGAPAQASDTAAKPVMATTATSSPVAETVASAVAPATVAIAVAVAVAAPVVVAKRRAARPLASQLASQAALNVPAGRKPRLGNAKAATSRPLRAVAATTVKAKRSAKPRSVFLQARHMAPKPAQRGSNVVVLARAKPSSARTAAQRTVRIAA